MEDNTKQPLTADASLYNGQPTDTGSSCPSARLTSCTSSIPRYVRNGVSVENGPIGSNASNTKYSNMKEEFMNMKKLYHYTKFDTAIKILESHSLRFGRLHNMNDIHENDKLSYVDTTGTLINSFPSDLLDAIDCEMAKYRQISLTADDDKQDKLGFDLHQMWGLYADKGQGVCLVFNKDMLCKQIDDAVLHKIVSYDTSVESFYIANSNDFQSIQRNIQEQAEMLFFHKRKEWEHEQEYGSVEI